MAKRLFGTSPEYRYRQEKQWRLEDEQDAKLVLQQLIGQMSAESYQAWVERAISERDTWAEIRVKAEDMLNCIARSADEADYRQTLRDALPL